MLRGRPQRVRGTSRGRARGRGRGRGRGGRQGLPERGNPTTRGGSRIIVQDAELFNVEGGFKTYSFNPAHANLPRLKAEASKYTRYKISFMNIAYISASSTATSGAVKFGIAPGTANANITDGNIMSLRPAEMVPVWKNATINVAGNIDSSRYMFVGDTSVDGVSFTLYVSGAKDVGAIKVSYRVELAFPKP